MFCRTPLILLAMTMLTISRTSETFGDVRDVSAQPVAPGICALTWEAQSDPGNVKIERRVGDREFQIVGTCAATEAQYIDRFDAKVDEAVAYRMTPLDAGGNVAGAPLEYITANSANLLPSGSFDMPLGSVPQLTGLSVSASAPWSTSIVEGGPRGQGSRCMQFSTSDPNAAATYIMSSRWFIVTPRTAYQFTWWTTESAHGTSFADGQAYGMTRERQKSFYEKTASLYVWQATRQGEWVGSSSSPRLPRDIRYVYVVIRGQGKLHPQPVRVADISIIDRDIELLQTTNLDELVSEARLASEHHAGLGLSAQVQSLTETAETKHTELQSPKLQDIDAFLLSRADLCDAIRELHRLSVVFRLAEVQ